MTTGIEGSNHVENSYNYIESGYSLRPHEKYCDFTGLIAKYQDRKTGLRYHDFDFYKRIQKMSDSIKNDFLEVRDAVTILK